MIVDRFLASNLLPDTVVRWGIRRALSERVAELRRTSPEGYADLLRAGPVAVHTEEANTQHYEVPAEFFRLVLGPRLKYSCAYFPAGVTELADAEEAMLELTCARARIGHGQSILELGCGWGSLSLWMAEHFPHSRIVAVSNSASQKAFIDGQASRRSLRNLEVRTHDMRDFSTNETFDRIVSVEMFEHMRNYEELLRRVASWLAPDGTLFVHVFSHERVPYLFEDRGPSDWMARHFFTGGQMPSRDLLPQFQSDLRLLEQWPLDGTHYERTAQAWLANMDAAAKEVREVFARVYGSSASRFFAYWRVFFMAVAETWGYDRGREWGVSHYRFGR
ncbi:MAG: cyclopropane-fatty-acyl-phospholipid synthase family protein [Acidobacteriota bacterium]